MGVLRVTFPKSSKFSCNYANLVAGLSEIIFEGMPEEVDSEDNSSIPDSVVLSSNRYFLKFNSQEFVFQVKGDVILNNNYLDLVSNIFTQFSKHLDVKEITAVGIQFTGSIDLAQVNYKRVMDLLEPKIYSAWKPEGKPSQIRVVDSFKSKDKETVVIFELNCKKLKTLEVTFQYIFRTKSIDKINDAILQQEQFNLELKRIEELLAESN